MCADRFGRFGTWKPELDQWLCRSIGTERSRHCRRSLYVFRLLAPSILPALSLSITLVGSFRSCSQTNKQTDRQTIGETVGQVTEHVGTEKAHARWLTVGLCWLWAAWGVSLGNVQLGLVGLGSLGLGSVEFGSVLVAVALDPSANLHPICHSLVPLAFYPNGLDSVCSRCFARSPSVCFCRAVPCDQLGPTG